MPEKPRKITAREVLRAVSPRVFWGTGEETFNRIVTDSRVVAKGDLFVALKGKNFDGNDFAPDAAKKGAGVVVERFIRQPAGSAVFMVADTTRALMLLGAANRGKSHAAVFAVTGSSGKTTTKEMLACILKERFNTLYAEKSFNNHVGVSLTLLALRDEHETAVFEIGTNSPGEVRELAKLVQPDVGIVTMVGRAHLAGFGSIEGVAREKAGMLEGIREGGVAVLNYDDLSTRRMAASHRGRVVTFGEKKGADFLIEKVAERSGCIAFNLSGVRFEIPVLGAHNAYNAAAAAAAVSVLGLSLEDAAAALMRFKTPGMRLEASESGGVKILNDAFNANPDSMKVALLTLKKHPCAGRRVAVLADMKELGPESEKYHREIAHDAKNAGVKLLVAVGEMSGCAADEARKIAPGMEVVWLPAATEAAIYLAPRLRAGDVVLFKGSRSMNLGEAVSLVSGLLDAETSVKKISA
jgi:UDP-N-acetylmuramoyl-tripeptide--D-alanyl-D-alanine ligase